MSEDQIPPFPASFPISWTGYYPKIWRPENLSKVREDAGQLEGWPKQDYPSIYGEHLPPKIPARRNPKRGKSGE